MFEEVMNKFAEIALRKKKMVENSTTVFFVLSLITGVYLGIINLFVYSISAPFYALDLPVVKILIGSAFSTSIILIVFTNTDLFTGNAMYASVGVYSKKINILDYVKILSLTYIGNFIGSVTTSYIFKYTGLLDIEATHNIILNFANVKCSLTSMEVLLRGIFCNTVVCLSIFTCFRTTSDITKILILFCTTLAFVTSGFEHGIANMSLFAMAYFIEPESISLLGIFNNLLFSALGNAIAGSLLVGGVYYYVYDKTREIV